MCVCSCVAARVSALYYRDALILHGDREEIDDASRSLADPQARSRAEQGGGGEEGGGRGRGGRGNYQHSR